MRPNSPRRILVASLVGTAIEFFDFYIYGTAAVLIFPQLFFPSIDPAAATLASLATFAIAFVARPVGSMLFGHFGDRVGRKATLVAALLTMGVSTVAIGLLPTYHSIGIAAPILLALCRFGQGLGLGGEWGGAVLLAVENAPPGKRAWYGMFPQLGAPVGFFFSGITFLVLSQSLSNEQFLDWGWRIPFVASALLVAVGLYVRLAITETPVFAKAAEQRERVPMFTVVRHHSRALGVGILLGLSTMVLLRGADWRQWGIRHTDGGCCSTLRCTGGYRRSGMGDGARCCTVPRGALEKELQARCHSPCGDFHRSAPATGRNCRTGSRAGQLIGRRCRYVARRGACPS
jgi:MFS family permease